MTFCPFQNWKKTGSRSDADKIYLRGNEALLAVSSRVLGTGLIPLVWGTWCSGGHLNRVPASFRCAPASVSREEAGKGRGRVCGD